MRINFYLEYIEVTNAYFRRFSAACDVWVATLKRYYHALLRTNSWLKLTYRPQQNVVVAEYDTGNTILCLMAEEVMEQLAK